MGAIKEGYPHTTKSVPKLQVTRLSWTKPGKFQRKFREKISRDGHQGRKIKKSCNCSCNCEYNCNCKTKWPEKSTLNAERALRIRGDPMKREPPRGGHTTAPLGYRDETLNKRSTVGPRKAGPRHPGSNGPQTDTGDTNPSTELRIGHWECLRARASWTKSDDQWGSEEGYRKSIRPGSKQSIFQGTLNIVKYARVHRRESEKLRERRETHYTRLWLTV